MKIIISLLTSLLLTIALPAFAQESTAATDADQIEELNPFDPDVEQQLEEMDKIYEAETGLSAHPETGTLLNKLESSLPFFGANTCFRLTCPVFLYVNKASQRAEIYVNGQLAYSDILVSTGAPGHGTPDFDKHPDGRIYDYYMSGKFPGGNYITPAGKKMGNMPYAVFIRGGFAVHGTPQGNWKKLGTRDSHGCVRMHPDNGYIFNRLVRQYGVTSTWITVE